ncbi:MULTISPECIES: hypothetical protein [Clostridium]|uniref:Uncharacterized protein n=2 Tax=Clostridium TaxID=1485 RepID=A0AA47ELP0_9CLOT|nr:MULTISPECIES: hypothetical protein [Clostridium]MBU3102286.1 hypothetical protein [Clostridium sp. DSM 17811]MBU3157330.1 hypothetical protein [Clostridium estertheticum]WAG62492.1 hypothetical protein LL038_09745 [Clostridium estertheticum]
MKFFSYLLLGVIVFGVAEFLSIMIGSALGSGTAEIGLVVSAISMLCATVVICTAIIVDAIRSNTQGK